MQPERATRGIAAVALSSATCGLLLLALALLLAACGGASSAGPASSASAASSSSPSTPAGTTPATSAAAPSTTAPGAPASSAAPTDGTVPSVTLTTAAPVPLTTPAPLTGGGTITIGTITSIEGTAQLPGEVAGPAVQVPVTITNGAGAAINLDQVVVDLVDRSGVSAGQLTADPVVPFAGTLAPGATARAVYVFTLATDDRQGVRILVSYTTAAPVVVFTGTIA